jgi:hypothetical protein
MGATDRVATTGTLLTPARPRAAPPAAITTGKAVRGHVLRIFAMCQQCHRGLQSRPWDLPRRRQGRGWGWWCQRGGYAMKKWMWVVWRVALRGQW